MCLWKCPNCGKSDHSGCSVGMTTLMYFAPHYVDGVNVNPDRNTITRPITCHACGKSYQNKSSFDFNEDTELTPSK